MILHKTFHSSTALGRRFILSDETLDRYGDCIRASGWSLASYRRNNIALFNHDANAPIGNFEDVRVEGRELRGTLVLAPKGSSPRIDEIHSLVDANVLRSVSVGFQPIESQPLLGSSGGTEYLKCELMEASLVAVPANPNAIAIAKSLGISKDTLKMVFQPHDANASVGQRIDRSRALTVMSPAMRKITTNKSKVDVKAELLKMGVGTAADLADERETQRILREAQQEIRRRGGDYWKGQDVRPRWNGVPIQTKSGWGNDN